MDHRSGILASRPGGTPRRPLSVFLACAGLGHVQRGFESFSEECFGALHDEPTLRISLFQGAGQPAADRYVVPTLRRKAIGTRIAAQLVRRDPLSLEMRSFAHGMRRHLRQAQPAVVLFSEPEVGALLARWRRSTGAGFRLLLSNGGPVPWGFRDWDYAQQLTPGALRSAVACGWPPERQSMVPYGISINDTGPPPDCLEKTFLRARLGLPSDRPILLCVSALDTGHKRVDYVVREVASLGVSAPHLVILGEPAEGARAIQAAAAALPMGSTIRCVPHAMTRDYYRAADALALASLDEGFGRVLLEAMIHGLPCIVHDYHVTRFVLGPLGWYGDLRGEGALAALIPSGTASRGDLRRRIQERVRSCFSWSALRSSYVEMLHAAAAVPLAGH
jgi:1,2-diacylglycerol 3-alpha-glucosyltransferase